MKKKNISKKALMINSLLTNYRFYDMSIYKVIMSGCLDDIIESLDETEVVSNVDKNKIVTPQEQFLGLLTRFISYYKNNFYNVEEYIDHLIIQNILANQIEFKEYLNQKMYLGDNTYIKYFEDILPKISILNFVKNAKLFNGINEVFRFNKIKLKNIDEYSQKDIMKIFNLLTNIIECSNMSFWNLEFLEDYKYSEESGVKEINESNYVDSSESKLNEFKEAYYKRTNVIYDAVLESYYKKIDILNKLKNIE